MPIPTVHRRAHTHTPMQIPRASTRQHIPSHKPSTMCHVYSSWPMGWMDACGRPTGLRQVAPNTSHLVCDIKQLKWAILLSHMPDAFLSFPTTHNKWHLTTQMKEVGVICECVRVCAVCGLVHMPTFVPDKIHTSLVLLG